jgi:hypothetical protein
MVHWDPKTCPLKVGSGYTVKVKIPELRKDQRLAAAPAVKNQILLE